MPSTDETGKNTRFNAPLVSFLAALSSAISIVEDSFLPFIPLPGVSFGLNNAVFLVNIDKLKAKELLAAQILKAAISGILFRGLNLNYLALSFSGALASSAVLLFYKKFLSRRGFFARQRICAFFFCPCRCADFNIFFDARQSGTFFLPAAIRSCIGCGRCACRSLCKPNKNEDAVSRSSTQKGPNCPQL